MKQDAIGAVDECSWISTFLAAIEKGDTEGLKRCLAKGVDPNSITKDGQDALTLAASLGNCDIIQLLLEAGADVEGNIESENTPLMVACQCNRWDIIQILKLYNPNVNEVDIIGYTALHHASHAQADLEIFDYLLEAGADINARNMEDETALFDSCSADSDHIAHFLLDHGASPHLCYCNGKTPLMEACWGGHVDLALRIIGMGVDLNASDSTGHTALIRACEYKLPTVVIELLKHGVDVSATMIDGNSALHGAVVAGMPDIVARLVSLGANTEQLNKEGQTAYEIARISATNDPHNRCYDYSLRILEAVEENKLKPHASTLPQGLIYAARHGLLNRAKEALAAGECLEARNGQGNTALILASRYGYLCLVEYLLEQGADINARNKKGATALAMACYQDREDVALYLINHGADVNIAHHSGRTALMQVAIWGNIHIARKLVAQGADIHALDCNGENALTHAFSEGSCDIIRLLEWHGSSCPNYIHSPQKNKSKEAIEEERMQETMIRMDMAQILQLLNRGVSPHIKSICGDSILHLAAIKQDHALINKLVELGVDINILGEDDYTPLHLLVESAEDIDCPFIIKPPEDTLKLLLELGANINARNRFGDTPLHSVLITPYPSSDELALLLIELGADVALLDASHMNALALAKKHKRTSIVRCLEKLLS